MARSRFEEYNEIITKMATKNNLKNGGVKQDISQTLVTLKIAVGELFHLMEMRSDHPDSDSSELDIKTYYVIDHVIDLIIDAEENLLLHFDENTNSFDIKN